MTAVVQSGDGSPMLKTGEAARLLHVSANTLRSWERRSRVPMAARSDGGHRNFDRRVVAGLRDALQEGYVGDRVVTRALELVASGRYDEPEVLRVRLTAVERELGRLAAEIRIMRAELRRG